MSLIIRTDVTAVKLHLNFIIAGIGSFINVYSNYNFKLLAKVLCLKGQKIYGFVPLKDYNKIIVFGGKQFTVISLEKKGDEESDIEVNNIFQPIICVDWLHSVTWIDNELIAVLTAHNTVQIWNLSTQTMVKQYNSCENSILYSGLLMPMKDGLVIFAGTVFSDVIIHTTKSEKPLHYLKGHRGVIFSISVDLERGIIVTTSDDRSVRIWTVTSTLSCCDDTVSNTTDYWHNVNITSAHEVYGHLARVMRSCITAEYIISIGEDSAICFWDHNGKLVKKNMSHQNGCIWSVDADSHSLLTGGGDSAAILHPLTTPSDYDLGEIVSLNTTPRRIIFTARKNILILDDDDSLIHYDISDKTQRVYRLKHESTYKLFSVSECKQLVAVADMSGKLDVFAENCKEKAFLINLINTKLNFGKLLSMHWAGNRHLVFCAENGVITVLSSESVNLEDYMIFELPHCKERWLTSVAMDSTNNILVVGDRCGNVHIYYKGSKNPIKTFKKVHGRYGPTSIVIKRRLFMTTGRDGTIKYFTFNTNTPFSMKYTSCKDLDFQWVEKFIDKDQNVVCGFQERIFVVYNIKDSSKLLEVPCGGGHRSWDVTRYFEKIGNSYQEVLKFIYIKNSDVHSHAYQMNKIISTNVIKGSHSREINCLKVFKINIDKSLTFYVTGGEDTTLRISSVDSINQFQDEIIFKHLSNIRIIKLVQNGDDILLISAGGRAQICIRAVKVSLEGKAPELYPEELVDFLIKGTDKERKSKETWKKLTVDFDPETRIMDLDLIMMEENKMVIFAGCSDALLRIFSYAKGLFEPVQEYCYHKTCILKTICIQLSRRNILISCTTRGEMALWDVTEPLGNALTPFFVTTSNKSGINSIDVVVISDTELLIATGGDDNAVHLSLLEIPVANLNSTAVKLRWFSDKFHCSQVTGLKFVDNYLLSTSIDQRITVSKWSVDGEASCVFQSQLISDVADIQGLEILERCVGSVTVCVYGKGMEVLRVPLT